MNGEMVVIAVGEIQASVLAHLCAALTETFERPCRVGGVLPVPEHAFDPRRAQYSAQALLQQLFPRRAEWVQGNVLLQAVALNLGAVPFGAFEDDTVKQGLLPDQQPLYLIPVGHPR
jgi:nitroreductase